MSSFTESPPYGGNIMDEEAIMRKPVHGFVGPLRTRDTYVEPPPKLHCEICGAVLRKDNEDPICSPCKRQGYEPPEWAVELAQFAEDWQQPSIIDRLAKELREK